MCRRAEEEVAPGWFSDNFNFCCKICLYFGISNFKIYPTYTKSSKYIFPDLNNNNAQFGIFTSCWRLFLCKSEHKMSSLSHTCIRLQKINWLSYLHTKRAKLLQKWQYKSHQKKKSIHRLNWNIQHSFQNFPKKMASATIFSLWYKCLNFIDIIVNANSYCNDTWKNITKQQITK